MTGEAATRRRSVRAHRVESSTGSCQAYVSSDGEEGEIAESAGEVLAALKMR